MSRYQLTPEAADDLFEIWQNVAIDNAQAADRLEARIKGACEFLARGPFLGHTRRDLTLLPLRFWALPRYRKYIIVYDPATKPLRVLRILHGARDLPEIL